MLYTLFTDNHDQAHYISRLGNDKELRYECATMYAAMFYLLKGIPFIYQGQEFGTPDPYYNSIDSFNDVETFNYFNTHRNEKDVMNRINFGSRDNQRRPMCWNNTRNYGFSNGDKTWTALHSRGAEINLENDKKNSKSVLEFYKKILALRNNSKTIKYGMFKDLTNGNGCFAYSRTFGEETITVVCNFEKEQQIYGLQESAYHLGNYGTERKINGNYKPYEVAVYIGSRNGQ